MFLLIFANNTYSTIQYTTMSFIKYSAPRCELSEAVWKELLCDSVEDGATSTIPVETPGRFLVNHSPVTTCISR